MQLKYESCTSDLLWIIRYLRIQMCSALLQLHTSQYRDLTCA